MQATMENIILAKGDYVDLLINDQVIGLARVESIESGIYYVGKRVNAGYVAILLFWSIQCLKSTSHSTMFLCARVCTRMKSNTC